MAHRCEKCKLRKKAEKSPDHYGVGFGTGISVGVLVGRLIKKAYQ